MAGREKLPNKRRVIRRINFMTTDNGTNSHHTSPLPLESMLVQDRIMLINKLPEIQSRVEQLQHGVASVEKSSQATGAAASSVAKC